MDYEDFFWALVISILLYFSIGCANMPTAYYDTVQITSGYYKGKRGRLIGDCSGFENYKVRLNSNKIICVRSWNMERI